MFREGDIMLADEDIESDYLLALECQQTGLADDDAAATRGTSVDSFLRVSTETLTYGDLLVQNAHLDQWKLRCEGIKNEIG